MLANFYNTSGMEIDYIVRMTNAMRHPVITGPEKDLISRAILATKPGLTDREEMKRMADIFRGRIIDVTDSTFVVELTGNSSKLDSFISAIDAGLILETVRTGVSGIGRGDRILKV